MVKFMLRPRNMTVMWPYDRNKQQWVQHGGKLKDHKNDPYYNYQQWDSKHGWNDEEEDDIEVEGEYAGEDVGEGEEDERTKLITPRQSGYVCYVDNDSGKKGTIGWIQVDQSDQKIFFHSQNFMEQYMETLLTWIELEKLEGKRVTFYVDVYKTKRKEMLTALAIRPEQDIIVRRTPPTSSGKGKKGDTKNTGKGKGKDSYKGHGKGKTYDQGVDWVG